MLGDGLNDGPALAAADVGVAVSAGLQLTLDAADVVVNKGDFMLLRLSRAVRGAQDCHALVMQNLILAAFVKVLALVLAATGYLSLSGGVLSDSLSFLVVLFNSLRPLKWKFADFEDVKFEAVTVEPASAPETTKSQDPAPACAKAPAESKHSG